MPNWLQMARNYNNPDSNGYKLAYLREQMEQQMRSLGDLAYADQVQLAMLGETIIIGGFLRTELIAANSIVGDKIAAQSITADKLDVQTLSAISADLGEVTGGIITGVIIKGVIITGGIITGGIITGATIRTSASGDRIQLDQSRLRAYLDNVMRVQLDYDSVDFYNIQNIHVGSLLGSYFDDNHKMIIHSSRGAEMVASTDFVAGSNENPDSGARVVVYSDHDGFAPSARMEAGTNRSTNFASISVGDNGYGSFLGKGFTCYGDFEVFGDKSAVVETESYGYRKLYALETPDCRFVTYMEMELETGEHYIEIEPMFRQTISDYFVVPHIQNMAEVSILERGEKGFKVLVGEKKAGVVFEINGIRKGYEDVYMEKAGCGFEQYRLSRLKRGVINETSDSRHEQGNSDTETSDRGASTDKCNSPGED